MQCPSKISSKFFSDLQRMVLNFIRKSKNHRIAKTILYNKRTFGGITIPDFKHYYRATVLKTAWYWHKNRQEDQRDQIDDPDINSHKFEHLIFDMKQKKSNGRKEGYLTNAAGLSGYQHVEE